MRPQPTLYVFAGLLGTGKSTLAQRLAETVGAAYLRIDTIEQELRDLGVVVESEGYRVAYRVAYDILMSGCSVVADSVNPLKVTRQAWNDIATKAKARSENIEIVCSDENVHRHTAGKDIAESLQELLSSISKGNLSRSLI